jgi:hypothetical protein
MKSQLMAKTLFKTSTLFTMATLLFMTICYAEADKQEVLILDGREVLLNKDGTWKYLSTDRYVDTKNGNRVRLKDDGSWQYVGNAPLISKEQVRTSDLGIKLQKVVVETYEKKVQKNTRVKTQTVFYLQLNNSAQAQNTIQINNSDISLVEVKDNNGKIYPVLSIKADSAELKPDAETTVVVRVKKSPSIFDNVKSMAISFKTGIFGIDSPITLSHMKTDFDEEKVDGFNNDKN